MVWLVGVDGAVAGRAGGAEALSGALGDAEAAGQVGAEAVGTATGGEGLFDQVQRGAVGGRCRRMPRTARRHQ